MSILGITSSTIFDVIDMIDNENLEYIALLYLEWFVDNNCIINRKTQELIIPNNEHEVHIPLNKVMNDVYTEASNHSGDNGSSDGNDSIG